VAGALVERMAARLLVFFARHAALLRPLGAAGKLQLAQAPLRPVPHVLRAACSDFLVCILARKQAAEASVLCAAAPRLLLPCWGATLELRQS